MKKGRDVIALNIIAYVFCGFIALICLIPFLMILAGSFSSETAIMNNGFSLLPQDFSLEAYKTVFNEPMVVVRAYATTIGLTIFGTALGLALQTMTAYVLVRKEFEWRNVFSFFFYFTTLFSGGLVPYYLLIRQTLGLADSYLALLLPLVFSVYNLLIMKSYIQSIPESLIDAAKIDGCGEFRTLVQVLGPLIKAALATVGPFHALAYWNDW
ncbi:MAG: carbohydrate ABC transporter permease, partial [Acetatifactor sp.]|nr:carbohydrate ABC transporter permease [Acetatifactor sp.]